MKYDVKRFDRDNWAEAMDVLSTAFMKNGVKKDFAEMYPRVFRQDARQLRDHFVFFPEGKSVSGNICGCISNCEMTYRVGGEILKISSSGNVAVKESARGTGLMTVMFSQVDKALHEENFDLSYLHGARTRYNYFDYELCGVEYLFDFDMADLSKHFQPSDVFTFAPLTQHEGLLEEAVAIIHSQKVFVERRADELLMVLTARWREPIAVFRNGQFWGTFAYGEGGIKYLALKGYEDFAQLVYEFLRFKGISSVPYAAPDYDKVLLSSCMERCSSFAVGNPANFKILHFDKVVKAFLQLKADNTPLYEGQLTVSSNLFGSWRIAVSGGKVTVESFDGEAEFTLKGFDIYDFLFNFTPKSYGPYHPAVTSWFPLPINAPYLA